MGKTKLIKSEKTGRYGLTSDDGKTVEVLPDNARLMQGKSGRWGLTYDNGQTVEVLDDFDDSSIDSSLIVENPFLQKKKEQEVAPSESLDGQSTVQKDQGNHIEITNPKDELEKLKSEPRGISDYYSQTFSDVDPNIGKYFKSLENIQNNPNENNIDVVKNITSHQKAYENFTNKVVGRYNPITDSYEYMQLGYKPKEGDVVGGTEKVGGANFLQLKDGKWQKVDPPDPSFGYGEQESVTVTGYKELQKPKYVQGLEEIGKKIFGEDFNITADQTVTPEEWQKNVNQLSPLSKEFATYNKDNDKGNTLPKFLNGHPDLKQNLEKTLQETPTQLESTEGRKQALERAFDSTYKLSEKPIDPFTPKDPSQLVDAPKFYKNLEILNNTHKELKNLKDKFDALKDNPKYAEQYAQINQEIKKLYGQLQPIMQFFEQPNNKSVIDRLQYNDQLLEMQKKGYDLMNGIHQFFPKASAEESKRIIEDAESINDGFWKKYVSNPIVAAWGASKNALLDIGAEAVEGGLSLGGVNEKKRREYRSAINELKSNIESDTYTPKYETKGPNGEILVGNEIANVLTDVGKMAGDLSPVILGGGSKAANAAIFGFQGYRNAKDKANKAGMGSDAESSLYALFNGALMASLGYGIGGKLSNAVKEFTPSSEVMSKMLNPATREIGAKELVKEMEKGGFEEAIKGAAKGTVEMKAINIFNALYNEYWNKDREGLEKLPTDVGGIMDDIKNFAAFGVLNTAMSFIGKKGGSKEEKKEAKKYFLLKAAQGDIKNVLSELDALRSMPNADIESIDATKDEVLAFTGRNFPKNTTPEQQVQLSEQAQIIANANKGKEITDKEYHGVYDDQIKEAQKNIDQILKEPAKVTKEVQESITPIVEKINKNIEETETTHPIGEVGHNDAVFEDKKTVNKQNKVEEKNEQDNQVRKPVDATVVERNTEEISKQTNETEPVKEEIDKDRSGTEEKPPVNTTEKSGIGSNKGNIETKIDKIVAEEENKGSRITHEGTKETRSKFGFGEYEKTKKSDKELEENADVLIKKGFNVGELLRKIEETDYTPSDEEYTVLKRYKPILEKEVQSNRSDENLEFLQRFVKNIESAGTREGRSFRSRQGLDFADDSLSGFFVRDRDANAGAPLTEKQKETVVAEYNNITEAKKKYDEKVAKLEAENARLQAEKEIKKIASKTKKQKKDFAKEREDIFSSIKDKLKKSRGETSAVVVPYLKELIVIAPDVAKLAKSYIEQGVTELSDIVKNIHGQLKEEIKDIKEEDIHNIIAGEYNEKKPTKSSLTEKYRNLQLEAKLINELQKLQSGEEPKEEKKKVVRNRKITELRKNIKDLSKEKEKVEASNPELPKKSVEEIALENYKKRTLSKINEIQEQLRTGDFSINDKKEPIKLDKEAIRLRDHLLKLKEDREIRLMKEEYQRISKGEKLGRLGSAILNTGRIFKSTFDVSMPFRQGLWGVTKQLLTLPIGNNKGFKNQKQLAGAFGKMYAALASEKISRRIMADIHESPRYELAQASGLKIAEPKSKLSEEREEVYGPSIVEKIPIIGKPVNISEKVPLFKGKIGGFVKASERAATTFINTMKWNIFNNYVDVFENQSQGKTFQNSKELYEAAATYANQAVGRGKLSESLERANQVTSKLLFSMRLQASRLQLLTYLANPRFYTKIPKEIRIEYLKDAGRFLAAGITTLFIANSLGFSVGLNPFSSDFGKVKVGNTTYDIWGGFAQWATFLSRIIAGKKTNSNDEDKEVNRGDIALRFLRSKLSPEAGTAVNLITGKDYLGQETDIKKEAINFITPLIISDIKQAYNDGGVQNAIIAGILATHGVGVQTYEPKQNSSYTQQDKSNPLYKKFVENNISLPELNDNQIEIEDKKSMTVKKLSEFEKEEVEKFSKARKKYIDSGLKKIGNYAYVDNYGRVSINNNYDDNKRRVKLDDLTKEQLKKVLSLISSEATTKAKKEIFHQ